MTAPGRSGLETPSYIFTAVLAGFVLLCLFIEKVIEFVEHRLPIKRDGLKAAFKKMISEIMLLGFISLLLTLGEESISKICVDISVYRKDWIPVEALDACDSCFDDMRRLSHFFDSNKRCEEREHEKSSSKEADEGHDHHPHARRTLLGHFGDWNPCTKHGEVQLISARALHEVHTFIFLIAVTHVFVVVMMFLIATWRVQQLKRWNDRDEKPSCLSVNENTGDIRFFGRSPPVAPPRRRSSLSALFGSHHPRLTLQPVNEAEEELLPESTPAETEQIEQDDIHVLERFVQGCRAHRERPGLDVQDDSSSQASPRGVNDDEAPVVHAFVRLKTLCKTEILVPKALIDSASATELSQIDESVSRQEWKTAFKKQFWSLITKDEFRNLTTGFFIEYKRASPKHFAKFDNLHYEEFLSSSLDDDIAIVVQIPLTGWIFVVAGYTIWPMMDWSAWPVLAIIVCLEAAVMIICAKLLTIVMLLTRDKTLHELTTKAFWNDDPGLLLPIIRNILFILTAVLSSIFMISWQYGFRSCPLAGKVANDHWIHEAATPLIFVFITLCFLHISFILMPLYSVTVHTSSLCFNKNLFHKLVKQAFHRLLLETEH